MKCMKDKQKSTLGLGRILLCLCLAAACGTMLWEAVSYERMMAQSPYPILGRVVIVVKMLLLIGAVLGGYCLVWKKARKRAWCRSIYAGVPTWAIVAVIVAAGLAWRAWAIAVQGDAAQIVASMDYEVAKYRHLLKEAPVGGTIADSYMVYAAKRSNEMLYQLWLLPLTMHLFGEGANAVYALNLLLEAGNIILMGACGSLLAKKPGAVAAAALYAVWPHMILNCSQVSPVLLAVFVLLCVLALAMKLILIASGEDMKRFQFIAFPLLGIMLAVLLHVSTAGVLIVPLVIASLLFRRMKSKSENGLVLFLNARFASGALILLITVCAELALVAGLKATTYHDVPNAYTAAGYSIAVGLDQPAAGRWNEADALLLQNAYDTVAVQKEFWSLSGERIAQMKLGDAPAFFQEKLNYLWRVFADMCVPAEPVNSLLHQRHVYAFLCMLALAAVGAAGLYRRGQAQAGVLAAAYIAQWLAALLLTPNQSMPVEVWVCPALLAVGMIRLLMQTKPAEAEQNDEKKHTSLVFKAEEIIKGGVSISATKASAEQSIAEKGDESLYVKAEGNSNLLVVEPEGEPPANP